MTDTTNPREWVNLYSNMLYRYAFVRVSDQDVAKDLVQDTFLSALKSSESFRGESSEKNWLFKILKNKIIDHYRKKASSLITDIDNLSKEADQYFVDDGHWSEMGRPKDWGIDYNKTVESKEFYKILQQCLNKLTELFRIVFSWKYLEEKDSKEICKELNISSSNYWVILHRAKLHLRKCIEQNWFEK